MTLLARRSPSSQGVDAKKVAAFLDAVAASGIELHSFMLLRHGAVVAEGWWAPYDRATPQLIYSMSKSFTAVAAGIAEGEGLLGMSDRLADRLPEATAYGEATIADALRMSVGHLRDPGLDPSDQDFSMDDAALRRSLRAYPPERGPGEVFTYDQLATFAVAKIVESATGAGLLDYLRPRLFEPIGASEARWFGGRANPGFSGLYLRTESIAAFGQVLLQGGAWRGRQLVPAAWCRQATRTQMPNDAEHRFPPGQAVEPDSARGYGYQFWMGEHGYAAGGAYGQTCLVMPKFEAVVAITAATIAGQRLFDLLWEHLVPAFGDGTTSGADDAALAERLQGLSVAPPVAGLATRVQAQALAFLGLAATAVAARDGSETPPAWLAAAGRAGRWAAEAAALSRPGRNAKSDPAPDGTAIAEPVPTARAPAGIGEREPAPTQPGPDAEPVAAPAGTGEPEPALAGSGPAGARPAPPAGIGEREPAPTQPGPDAEPVPAPAGTGEPEPASTEPEPSLEPQAPERVFTRAPGAAG
ncbi:MAG: serine hydrolase, partial [Bifidobacteriaceae bacterium]|nr:serine hydrolase [Bifidobacteriaceae bacterium]